MKWLLTLLILLWSIKNLYSQTGCNIQSAQWDTPAPSVSNYRFATNDFITGLPAPTLQGGAQAPLGLYEIYTNPAATSIISGVRVYGVLQNDPNDNMTLTITVHEFNAGSLGALLYSESGISPAAAGFDTTPRELAFQLNSPTTITSTQYAVGIAITAGDPTDSFQVLSSTNGQGSGAGLNYVAANGFGFINYLSFVGMDFDLGIVPLLGDYPVVNYGSNTFCTTEGIISPTSTGATNFLSSPAGLIINNTTGEIDLSSSNAGNYEISYQSCGITNSTNLNVVALDIDDLPDQTSADSFILPTITGLGLTGNERYYTSSLGSGISFDQGDVIHFSDFSSYPVVLYMYDTTVNCGEEERFNLTITSSGSGTGNGNGNASVGIPAVGINTSDPKATLHVAGTTRIDDLDTSQMDAVHLLGASVNGDIAKLEIGNGFAINDGILNNSSRLNYKSILLNTTSYSPLPETIMQLSGLNSNTEIFLMGCSSCTSVSIDGIEGGSDGKRIILMSDGSTALNLMTANSTSAPDINAIYWTNGVLNITNSGFIELFYDSNINKWRVIDFRL